MATTIDALKIRVLKRIDETVPQLSDGTVNRYNVDEFLEEAAIQILNTAPLHLVPIKDFSQATVSNKPDGSGSVLLPDGFIRLIAFKMQGWERPVHSLINVHSSKYARQHNKFLRGGGSKPVVAIANNRLEYYSLPANLPKHEIEIAQCVIKCKANELDERLHEPLCWLTAALILGVTNEIEASHTARKRYDELIIAQYGDNNL